MKANKLLTFLKSLFRRKKSLLYVHNINIKHKRFLYCARVKFTLVLLFVLISYIVEDNLDLEIGHL